MTGAELGAHPPSEEGLAGGLAQTRASSRCLGFGKKGLLQHLQPTGPYRPEGSLAPRSVPWVLPRQKLLCQPVPTASSSDAPVGELGEEGEPAS